MSVLLERLELGRKAPGGNFYGLHGAGDDAFKERRALVGKDDFGMDHVPRGLAQEVRIPEDQERLPVFRGHRRHWKLPSGAPSAVVICTGST